MIHGGLQGNEDAEAVGVGFGAAHLPHAVGAGTRADADSPVSPVEDSVSLLEDGGLSVVHLDDGAVGLPLSRSSETALDLEGDAFHGVHCAQVEVEAAGGRADFQGDVEGRQGQVVAVVTCGVEGVERHGATQGQIELSLPTGITAVDEAHAAVDGFEGVGLEGGGVVEGLADLNGFQDQVAVARGEEGGFTADGRGRKGSSADPPDSGCGEDPVVMVGRGQAFERVVPILGMGDEGVEEPDEGGIGAGAVGELVGDARPDAVAVALGHVEEGVGDAERHQAAVPVPAARHGGFHGPVGVEEVGYQVQVAAHRFQEFGTFQVVGHEAQRAVAGGAVDAGAALGELAVGVDVHAFGQDALQVIEDRHVWEQAHGLGQGRADDPAVIGGVETAADDRLGGGADVLSQVVGDAHGAFVAFRGPTSRYFHYGSQELHGEGRGIGRVPVGDDTVDESAGPLPVLLEIYAAADAFQEIRVAAEGGFVGQKRVAGARQVMGVAGVGR